MSTRARSRWLLTFADLSALLLAFFVLAYSMTDIDREGWQRVVEAVGAGFGDDIFPVQTDGRQLGSNAEHHRAESAGYLVTMLDERLERAGRPCGMRARLLAATLAVRFVTPPFAEAIDPGCAAAFRELRQILSRMRVASPELAVLELPAGAYADPAAALQQLSLVASRAASLLGFAPTVIASPSATEPREFILWAGPL